jgi:hypothetical protein
MAAHCKMGRMLGLVCLIGSLAAACSTGTRTLRPGTNSAPTPASASEDPTTQPPAGVPDFPAGVYRTRLTVGDLQKMGSDNHDGNSGVWTLTVKAGQVQLDCRTIKDPGIDCGGSDGGPNTEVGDVRGSSPEVWLVVDLARKSKLTGCTLEDEGCGPEGFHHLSWKTVPGGIAFTDLDQGGVDTWTAQPWTKIS